MSLDDSIIFHPSYTQRCSQYFIHYHSGQWRISEVYCTSTCISHIQHNKSITGECSLPSSNWFPPSNTADPFPVTLHYTPFPFTHHYPISPCQYSPGFPFRSSAQYSTRFAAFHTTSLFPATHQRPPCPSPTHSLTHTLPFKPTLSPTSTFLSVSLSVSLSFSSYRVESYRHIKTLSLPLSLTLRKLLYSTVNCRTYRESAWSRGCWRACECLWPQLCEITLL